MPIYLVFFSYRMLPNGMGVKDIWNVIPTTFEKASNEINKYREEMYTHNLQCDYWARHDEGLLENAARGE